MLLLVEPMRPRVLTRLIITHQTTIGQFDEVTYRTVIKACPCRVHAGTRVELVVADQMRIGIGMTGSGIGHEWTFVVVGQAVVVLVMLFDKCVRCRSGREALTVLTIGLDQRCMCVL